MFIQFTWKKSILTSQSVCRYQGIATLCSACVWSVENGVPSWFFSLVLCVNCLLPTPFPTVGKFETLLDKNFAAILTLSVLLLRIIGSQPRVWCHYPSEDFNLGALDGCWEDLWTLWNDVQTQLHTSSFPLVVKRVCDPKAVD